MSRFGDERRVAVQALEEDDAKTGEDHSLAWFAYALSSMPSLRPPVTGLVVPSSPNHFRTHVRICPDHRICQLLSVLVSPSQDTLVDLVTCTTSTLRQVVQVQTRIGAVETFPAGERIAFLQIDAMLAKQIPSLFLVVGTVMRPVEVCSQTKV